MSETRPLGPPKAEIFWVGDGGIYTHLSWCHLSPLPLEPVPAGMSPEPSTLALAAKLALMLLCLNDYLLSLNYICSASSWC